MHTAKLKGLSRLHAYDRLWLAERGEVQVSDELAQQLIEDPNFEVVAVEEEVLDPETGRPVSAKPKEAKPAKKLVIKGKAKEPAKEPAKEDKTPAPKAGETKADDKKDGETDPTKAGAVTI